MTRVLLILLALFTCDSITLLTADKINGLCLVAPPYEILQEHYKPIVQTRANWVAIIPYAFCSPSQSKVIFDHPNQWYGEKTEGIKTAISLAQASELKILLKPHLWVLGQGWAGDLNYQDASDLEVWQESYRTYLIHFSQIAEEMNVNMLSIGTEVRQIANQHPNYWKMLIQDIRGVYSGPITYSANWDNYENIEFWSDLDYIGIDAYFPTSTSKTPELSELLFLNEKVAKKLEQFSYSHIKKVLFTEFGFRSIDHCTAGHWKSDYQSKEINFEGQANAYEALFQTFWNQPWFAGGFAWKWEYKLTASDSRHQREFSPRSKKAEKILTNWYSK